jgi:hypothetical protein
MTFAHVGSDADFKLCCMKSGRFDGANRGHFFQGIAPPGESVHLCLRVEVSPP